jgi:glycosyltransferase involved in cell wall biosynthesis
VALPAGAVSASTGPRHKPLGTGSERVREAERRFQPDVVVAGPLQDATLAAVRAAAVPVAAISWAFDLLVDAVEREGHSAAQEALAGSAALLCDARVVARAAQALGMPRARITIAPWGVDLANFAPNTTTPARDELGWRDAFVIVSARSHEPRYGLDTVIDACAIASARVPSIRLLMLGDGSMRGALEERARSANLGRRVYFAGQADQSRLPGWYGAADLYVSASHVDGSSVSLMEAMASGLPAVVSDIPGNREWIEPGATGWLFPAGDPEALAAAIVEAALITHGERARMGRAARAIAELRADWTKNARRIIEAVAAAVPAPGVAR